MPRLSWYTTGDISWTLEYRWRACVIWGPSEGAWKLSGEEGLWEIAGVERREGDPDLAWSTN